MKIASHNVVLRDVLRALAAVAFCCATSQSAVSQQKRLSPVEQAEKLAQQKSKQNPAADEADKRQKEWDRTAAKTMKSICGNC
jgi:hypothetical protein